ncbi:MAG: NAD-binding protein [Candidatus Omnitrophica bacterium]|nr:NAD-binding protein [Candidatus Omnitrophota bacterium]MCM8798477.1 NAD-binding protein [Candidatus Omnitrophota bacterium]
MYIIIVGAGNVGSYLAKRLLEDKHVVVVVERDPLRCRELAKEMDALIIHGDGCDPKALEDAGAKRADVVAAVTGEDEDNLIICQLAKEKFGTKRTVARVNDSRNERTFNELGVDVPVDANAIVAKIIEEEVSFADFVTLMTFKRGKLAIVRVDLAEDSPVVNKAVKDLQLPHDAVLVSIIRGDKVIIPKGETVLEPRDDVIALTTVENEKQLLEYLVGKI